MRIIAGYLGGRNFDSPHGHRTHPMSEKIRGAIFNSLGDIKGLTVLDAFTGTGANAFEAISRGANSAVAIDIDKRAISTLVKSAQELGIEERVAAIQTAVISWSNRHSTALFDIVIADPPYDKVSYLTIEKIDRHVKLGGIYVLSLPVNARLILPASFELIKTKQYGVAKLVFYKRIA